VVYGAKLIFFCFWNSKNLLKNGQSTRSVRPQPKISTSTSSDQKLPNNTQKTSQFYVYTYNAIKARSCPTVDAKQNKKNLKANALITE
jgi:hypothetical protein